MPVKPVILAALLVLCVSATAQSARRDGGFPRFMGREVKITEAETGADGLFPKGSASVCLEGLPRRQCYTAPEGFGRTPTATEVHLDKNTPAILFSTASRGVSGFRMHFALLRPGEGKDLDDLFVSDRTVSDQSQYSFWSDPAVSDAQIFVTADYVWGPDEAHHGEHRYMISAYARKYSFDLNRFGYYLEDRYMTTRKYDVEGNADILASERQELLARLRRLREAAEPQSRRVQ